MWSLKEFVPDGFKNYIRLVAAKLRHPSCYIGSPMVPSGVRLGRHCRISRDVQLGRQVVLGDYSYVNCGSIIDSGRIGRFCSIGPHTLIGLANHPVDCLSTSPMLYGARNIFGRRSDWQDFPSPPVIGNDVWIGAGAFIKQGVVIGDGAVVGAGSIVTHDVPPFAVVAGVPAKLIRYRFRTEQREQLLRSPWWNLEMKQLMEQAEEFEAPSDARERAREAVSR